MKCLQKQRGSLLLIAIALILTVGLMATVFTSLYVGDTASSTDHATASQALFAAESGIEHAFYTYSTGIACNALTYTNIAVGSGSFTTSGTLYQPVATSLNGAITAAATVIPVASTAGYAPHGRITIQSEQIDYSAIVGNSFTGARRGANGTTAAAQANGQVVTQNQCLVRSTGAAGSARRAVEANAGSTGGNTTSDFLDGGSVRINTPRTTIGSLTSPSFAAGTNVVIASVALQNQTVTGGPINTALPAINANQLRLRRGNTNLEANNYQINVGAKAGVSPSATNFAREQLFMIGRETGVPAAPTYFVDAQPSVTGVIYGEVKMAVINNPPSSDRRAGNSNNVTTAGTNLLNNQQFTVSAGDRVILVAVQLFNSQSGSAGQIRTIPAGALQLRKGNAAGPILAQNQFAIDITSESNAARAANRSTSILLLARDPTGGNNQRYTVRAALANFGGGTSNVQARAQAVVIGLNANVSASLLDGGTVSVGTAETVIGSLATTLAAGEQLVIGAVQYENTGGAQRTIAAGNERLSVNALPQAVSQYGLDLCPGSNGNVCDDFASGLLWRTQTGTSSPIFSVRALASSLGINAEAKILALQMTSGVKIIDWLEVFQ
jgi:hypothetical protein